MKKGFCNFVKYLILTLLTISSSVVLYYVNKLNILELRYFILLCSIISLLWILILFKLFRKKTRLFSKIIFGLIALILSFFYVFTIKYVQNTINFVENITSPIEYEIQKYSVLVLNDSNYNTINDLDKKSIGFVSLSNSLEDVNDKLKQSSNISFTSGRYNDVSEIIEAITNRQVDAIVLEKSFVDSLDENDYHLSGNTKTIYTFELKVKKEKSTQKVDVVNKPFILYISGSDSRESLYENSRSDVNILAIINPKKHKLLLLSIPRDTYVQLHNTVGTKDKLTHAGLYGVEMSKNTIEDFLNIDINYYAKVSFKTLINVVDVIGGIDLYSEKSFTAWTDKSCRFKTGINTVNGKCALAFSRERYTYSTGDIHRGQNQQQVLTKIIQKLSDTSNLSKYDQILSSVNGSFETDMTYDEITNLVKYQLNEFSSFKVESIGIIGNGKLLPTYSLGTKPLYVMIPDDNSILLAQAKIKEYMKD
ncbi:MAG: LCP family protein [Bacilli bacterium]|nr:LCP family protein [Bacilli bacterium]